MTVLAFKPALVAIIAILGLAAGSAFAGNTVYKYDTLGRVIEVDYPNGTVIKYAYDKAGNRTQTVKTAAANRLTAINAADAARLSATSRTA